MRIARRQTIGFEGKPDSVGIERKVAGAVAAERRIVVGIPEQDAVVVGNKQIDAVFPAGGDYHRGPEGKPHPARYGAFRQGIRQDVVIHVAHHQIEIGRLWCDNLQIQFDCGQVVQFRAKLLPVTDRCTAIRSETLVVGGFVLELVKSL